MQFTKTHLQYIYVYKHTYSPHTYSRCVCIPKYLFVIDAIFVYIGAIFIAHNCREYWETAVSVFAYVHIHSHLFVIDAIFVYIGAIFIAHTCRNTGRRLWVYLRMYIYIHMYIDAIFVYLGAIFVARNREDYRETAVNVQMYLYMHACTCTYMLFSYI